MPDIRGSGPGGWTVLDDDVTSEPHNSFTDWPDFDDTTPISQLWMNTTFDTPF